VEFDELDIFIMISKYKSFSAAARHMYLSQATISTKIKNLEHKLGVPLFYRNNSIVSITEAGSAFMPYAQQMLSLKKESETHMDDFKHGSRGRISLAASHTICDWVLPDIIRKFRKDSKNIDFVLHTSFTNDTIDKVLSGEVQFGLIRMPHAHFSDDRFYSKLLEVDKTFFFAHPNHALFHIKEPTMRRIAKELLIVYGAPTSYWPQIKNVFEMQGLVPNPALEFNDIHAVKLYAQLSSYIGYLPELTLQHEIRQHTLKIIPLKDYVPIKRYSLLIYLKDRYLTGISKDFVDFINSLDILDW